MKEVSALRILSESKARNINHVIEALPVGKAMWMITEYCGGGSVATLVFLNMALQIVRSTNHTADEAHGSRRSAREMDCPDLARGC